MRACVLSTISLSAAIPSCGRINADYAIADEGQETGRRGGVITFCILIPWIYGHDFRFEIIDRRKPQWNETEWNIGWGSFNPRRFRGREKEGKGCPISSRLAQCPGCDLLLETVSRIVYEADPNTRASPVTDFKQTIIAGYACDYDTSSFPHAPSFRLTIRDPFEWLLVCTVNFLWALLTQNRISYRRAFYFIIWKYRPLWSKRKQLLKIGLLHFEQSTKLNTFLFIWMF